MNFDQPPKRKGGHVSDNDQKIPSIDFEAYVDNSVSTMPYPDTEVNDVVINEDEDDDDDIPPPIQPPRPPVGS
jgi:hypothetical protein